MSMDIMWMGLAALSLAAMLIFAVTRPSDQSQKDRRDDKRLRRSDQYGQKE